DRSGAPTYSWGANDK
nr:Chain CCC, Epitope III peptide GLY-ALA-PRO-THR-TYR-SER-TRP-GLY [Hepacivirus hominis]7LKI_FFF Chain FFF, Epitope III peptide GLY-ALA-PRO-THR-TYR-SER-TRP-GLY [Hepacivirus hominis]